MYVCLCVDCDAEIAMIDVSTMSELDVKWCAEILAKECVLLRYCRSAVYSMCKKIEIDGKY